MRKGWLLLSVLLVACGYARVAPTTIPVPPQPAPVSATPLAVSFRTIQGSSLVSLAAPTPPVPTVRPSPTLTPFAPTSTPLPPIDTPSAPAVVLLPQAMTVIGEETVNVRGAPDLHADVVAQVEPGSDVVIIGPAVSDADGSSRWIHIQYGGTAGYIRDDLLKMARPTLPASAVIRR